MLFITIFTLRQRWQHLRIMLSFASEMNTIQLGVENTGCNLIIRNKLRDVRLIMLCE
jgi:hypothetical protein